MRSLLSGYRAIVCDLDGVVYRGPEPVPHAVESIDEAQAAGIKVAYATNNASRPPQAVADHLRALGLNASDHAVINSSMAGAAHLAQELPDRAVVLAVGGDGVSIALSDKGFTVVRELGDEQVVDAVLQGYGPKVCAADLANAAYAIQRGAVWVATNTDLTLPTALGTAPGNGSLVGAVRPAVDQDPVVVGKPGPLMYTMAAQALGCTPQQTLAIGDRLETDVAGARAAGMDCLHVLTGVHGAADLIAASPQLRPRYVAAHLQALHQPYELPTQRNESWHTAQAAVRLDGHGADARLLFEGDGDQQTRLRLALAALWEALDSGQIDTDQAVNAWVTSK